jgi:hypothetical protein
MTSPLLPLISLLPLLELNNKEEGDVDKLLFSVYGKFLNGRNDIIVAIYDANMETDIDVDVITIITRRIVACISLAYTSR